MISETAQRVLATIRRFADVLEITEGDVELEAIARMLAAQVPTDGVVGLLTVTRAAEEACEALVRRLARGPVEDRREYLRFVFRSIVRGEERPRRAVTTMVANEAPKPTGEPSLRPVPRGRERRIEAINEWLRDRNLPCPRWAIDGFNSPEEAEEAKQRAKHGLPGLPDRARPFTEENKS